MNEEQKKIFKQTIAATSGTILQWYDFSLFGYLAPIIATLYFPEKNETTSILYTFGLFAVSFLLAPMGSAFFGYISDNYGRKKALTLSILAMAIPTTMIGLLPTYNQIGILAPILLTIFRIVQGFVASAEFSGSAVFLVEHAHQEKSYLLGSLTSTAYSLGLLLGSIISAIATMDFMPSFAWRITFLLAMIVGILIFYMRKNISETPEFQQINRNRKMSFLTAIKYSKQSVFATMLIAWLVGIITFGTYVFSVTYLTRYSNINFSTSIIIVSFSLLLDAILEPFIAILADKYNGKIISLFGMLGFIVLSYPLFILLSSGNIIVVTIAMLCMSCLIAITYAPMNTILVRLFPPSYRASGFGVSFNLGIAIFGGTTPLVLTWIIELSGNINSPAIYYIVGGVAGLIALKLINNIQCISSIELAIQNNYSKLPV